jgi:HSP20 family molecular chaperone IbpA
MSENKDLVTSENKELEKTRELPSVRPLVDIFENDSEILLHADMPGVLKEDISINMDNGKLYLSGIRHMEKAGAVTWEEFGDLEYTRTFSVPQTIDVAKVSADLTDGVLKLHLPKSEAAKPRRIEINAA